MPIIPGVTGGGDVSDALLPDLPSCPKSLFTICTHHISGQDTPPHENRKCTVPVATSRHEALGSLLTAQMSVLRACAARCSWSHRVRPGKGGAPAPPREPLPDLRCCQSRRRTAECRARPDTAQGGALAAEGPCLLACSRAAGGPRRRRRCSRPLCLGGTCQILDISESIYFLEPPWSELRHEVLLLLSPG